MKRHNSLELNDGANDLPENGLHKIYNADGNQVEITLQMEKNLNSQLRNGNSSMTRSIESNLFARSEKVCKSENKIWFILL